MTGKEWIVLFFSESFEKQINDFILDDIDCEIPQDSILNYVYHVIDVPYKDYLDYVSDLEPVTYNKFDIPYFERFAYCERVLIEYLISQDNRGCTEEEVGKNLAYREQSIKGSTAFYGYRHLYSAKILGLVYEYYNHWYLNCIGYVYGILSNRQRASLLARTLLRSPFFRNLLSNSTSPVIYYENYMKMFTDRFVKKHLKSMLFFSDICVKEAHEYNIALRFKSSSKNYKTNGDYLNVDSIIPNNASKSLRLYFKDLRTFPVISDFEIGRLLMEYRNGYFYLLSLIVKASQLTVLRIALSFKNAPLEDTILEGNIGLLKAIEHFDHTRYTSFFNYAKNWVYQTIATSMVSIPYMIRLPINQYTLYYKIQKFKENYEQQNGCPPSVDAIEIDDDVNFEGIALLDKLPDNLKDVTVTYGDLDIFESSFNQIVSFEDAEYNKSYVYRLLKSLSGRDEVIVRLYFGIGAEPETLGSIGERFNLTRERTRQILVKSIEYMRDLMSNSESHDEINVTSVPSHDVKTLDVAKIGDYVEMPNNKQLGRVIYAFMLNGHIIYYVLGIEDKRILKMTKDGTLISDELKRSHEKRVKLTPERKVFLESFYRSENKNVSATRPQNKSDNHIPQTLQEKKTRVTENVVPKSKTLPYRAKVGDIILYDNRRGVVIEKRSSGGIPRLILKYDNGTYDNVPNDTDRYSII